MDRPVLLGDIGGTNARFALAVGGRIERHSTLNVADFADVGAAVSCFLDTLGPDTSGGEQRPAGAALACAGPVEDGAVTLTNGTWRIEAAALAERFGFSEVRLVNDFEALAWALPALGAGDLRSLGGGSAQAGAPAIVLGPGTGLGIATYLPPPVGPAVIVGEGGHATLPASDAREAAVIARLRERHGHVSAERLLCGDGLERLFRTLAELEGGAAPPRSAAEITEAAETGCAASRAALAMFCALLGTVAGNAALLLGARGGVYLAGGILPRIEETLAASDFRRRFEAKGRFQAYLAAVPTALVTHPEPAFPGLLSLLAAGS